MGVGVWVGRQFVHPVSICWADLEHNTPCTVTVAFLAVSVVWLPVNQRASQQAHTAMDLLHFTYICLAQQKKAASVVSLSFRPFLFSSSHRFNHCHFDTQPFSLFST